MTTGRGIQKSNKQSSRIWTINGDFLGLKPTGVARYGREVTLALDELISRKDPLTQAVEFVVVAPKNETHFTLKNIPIKLVPEYNYPRLPQVWSQMQLPRFVKGGLLSFSNLAPVSVRRHVVCIHDLHTFLMPESYGRAFRLAHRMILPALGRTARRVTTVSQFSKDCLVKYGIAPASKISVTYNGCDHADRWDASKSAIKLGPRPFVFVLGQSQGYKNTSLALKIAPALDKRGLDLYIAGDFDLSAVLGSPDTLPANVRLLGRVSDDELAALFSSALCFLFPSRIEGFGIPMMEAMRRGCPVIASTAPCMPEIGGEAALYADPDDTTGWIAAVSELQEQPMLREKIRAAGVVRAEKYTWRGVARIYLNLINQLDHGRHDDLP